MPVLTRGQAESLTWKRAGSTLMKVMRCSVAGAKDVEWAGSSEQVQECVKRHLQCIVVTGLGCGWGRTDTVQLICRQAEDGVIRKRRWKQHQQCVADDR